MSNGLGVGSRGVLSHSSLSSFTQRQGPAGFVLPRAFPKRRCYDRETKEY